MKKMLLAALLTLAAAPAFAADVTANLDEQTIVNEQTDMNAEALPPHRPGFPHRGSYMCYSRNILGRTFWGTGWSRGQASQASLWACRRGSRLPFGCHFIGCHVRW